MKISRLFLRIIKIVIVISIVLTIGIFIFFSISTDVTPNIDSYVYELPFKKGDKYKVVQGYGGLFSHRDIAALDFEMPVGTPVHAARGGIIYSYRDDSDEGGIFSKYKNKANYIIIKHDDGSFGCYWHLQKNGVLVNKGKVSKGQQIGISGATGLVLRPHLHFSVKLKLNYQVNSFTRTKFNTTNGVVILERGETYERPVD
ncbi:MAG: M23 family metallopeptidase [Chitinophagaceae bacterium]|jgi:murein DD-endopeptidase MepM/ murein hydrolase activator NlpD|nr:M23 family metallopeptidase [Chitinophagaceae bacterium]